MTSSVGVFAAAACPRRAASNSIDTNAGNLQLRNGFFNGKVVTLCWSQKGVGTACSTQERSLQLATTDEEQHAIGNQHFPNTACAGAATETAD